MPDCMQKLPTFMEHQTRRGGRLKSEIICSCFSSFKIAFSILHPLLCCTQASTSYCPLTLPPVQVQSACPWSTILGILEKTPSLPTDILTLIWPTTYQREVKQVSFVFSVNKLACQVFHHVSDSEHRLKFTRKSLE